MTRLKEFKPTESELEILAIMWKKKQATVRDVHEELSKNKDAGYTTTLKLMQIMHEKKLLTRDDRSKSHIYAPIVSQENTRKQFLHKMIDNLFGGSSAELVLQALGDSNPSPAELEKIRALIEAMKSKK